MSSLQRRRLLKAGAAAALGGIVPLPRLARGAPRTLRVLAPGHRAGFIREYGTEWGARNGIDVLVDGAQADRAGHDLILFPEPPALLQRELVPLDDVHAELERRFGPPLDLARKSTFNPVTGRFFALPVSFAPALEAYRPATGIDLTDERAVRTLLYAFGGFEQDENGAAALTSRHTLAALRYTKAHFQQGITLNLPAAGPARRIAVVEAIQCFGIPRASSNIDRAKRFLVDYSSASADAFAGRGGLELPCFFSAVPQIEQRLAALAPQLAGVLDDVLNWSTNIGFPGHASAPAVDLFGQSVLTRMFRQAAAGRLAPEDALAEADARCQAIWAKWQDRGLL